MTPIADLFARLRRKNISLWVEEGRLCYAAPAGAITPLDLTELRDRREEILAAMRNQQAQAVSTITRAPRVGAYPLTHVQESFLAIERFLPRNSLSNMFSAFLLSGPLQYAALVGAFRDLVERHESLRTRFEFNGDRAVQIVFEECHLDVPVEDLRSLESMEQQKLMTQWVVSEANQPIDVTTTHAFRPRLLRLREDVYILLLTVHHIVCDEWSSKLLIRELMHLFSARVDGRPPSLPELPIQLVDFAFWQQELVKSGALAPQLIYWRKKLNDGLLPPMNLPLDYPRPNDPDFRTARHSVSVPIEGLKALKELSRQENCTLFTVLLAAIFVLLQRLTGTNDVRLATQVVTRSHEHLEGIIGPLFDTLILRSNLPVDFTPRDALQQIRNVLLEAYDHQDLPFEALLRSLERDHPIDRAGFARVLFLFGAVQPTSVDVSGINVAELDVGRAMLELDGDFAIDSLTTFDLIISLSTKTRGVAGAFIYKKSLFSSNTIDSFIRHFDTIVADFIHRPDALCSASAWAKRKI